MKRLLLLGFAALLSSANAAAADAQAVQTLAPSAQIEEPPSPSKLLLIRRFLRAIGRQEQLDSGSFLERYALPGGPMWQVSNGQALTDNLKDALEKRMTALRAAYAPHRAEYQKAYESHVNWEFAEAELAEIVAFLERPVGKHFLDGRWRMEAYVGTDTEEVEEQNVKEAMASLAKWEGLLPPIADNHLRWNHCREGVPCRCCAGFLLTSKEPSATGRWSSSSLLPEFC